MMKTLFEQNLTDSSQFYFIITDTKGQIQFANTLFSKKSGYEPGHLSSFLVKDIIINDDKDKCVAAIEKCLRGADQKAQKEPLCLRQTGSQSKICWELSLVKNENDEPEAIQWIGIEDQMKMEEKTISPGNESRPPGRDPGRGIGILFINKEGKVLICNPASYELLGMSEQDLIAMPMLDFDWDIIHEDGRRFNPFDYPVAVALRTGKDVKDVVMGVPRSDRKERIWLLVNSEVVTDNNGDILYFVCSYMDMTEQKGLSRESIDQETQRQKMLMQAIQEGREKERSEISRELHDNISQHLTTTRLYLEVAKEKAEGELLEIIKLAQKGLTDMATEVRQLSQSLVPPSMSDIGLIASIVSLCNPLKNTHAFDIDFKHDHFKEALLSDNMKLMLFRIIQEQINNIIRHSQASSIKIVLQTEEGKTVLSVTDNGKGFDPAAIGRGFGFDNMSNRAELFGGKLKIDAAPGKGCTIQVTVPLSL